MISSRRLAVLKRDSEVLRQVAGIGIHCGIHAMAAGILLYWAGYQALLGGSLVFGSHFAIDFMRCRMEMRLWGPGKTFQTISGLISSQENPIKKDKKGLMLWGSLLGMDQIAHVLCLTGIAKIV